MVSVGAWFHGWHGLNFGVGGIGIKFWRESKNSLVQNIAVNGVDGMGP